MRHKIVRRCGAFIDIISFFAMVDIMFDVFRNITWSQQQRAKAEHNVNNCEKQYIMSTCKYVRFLEQVNDSEKCRTSLFIIAHEVGATSTTAHEDGTMSTIAEDMELRTESEKDINKCEKRRTCQQFRTNSEHNVNKCA